MTAAIRTTPHSVRRQPIVAVRQDLSGRPTPMTYQRRRAVFGVASAVVVAAGIVLAHDVLAGSSGVPASAAASQPAHTRPTTVARPGDSLWSIAEEYHGEISITRYVDKLVDLNGGPSIQAGQLVILP